MTTKRRTVGAALAAAGLLAGCSHRLPAPAAPVSVPNALGPPVRFDGGQVSPPAGLTMATAFEQRQNASRTLVTWKSARRPDGTRLTFDVAVIRMAPGHPNTIAALDPMVAVSEASSDLSGLYSGYTSTPPDVRVVNGVRFGHVYWKGFSPRSHVEEHGFIYRQSEPGGVLSVRAVDSEPSNAATLPLCERAAETFSRR